MTVVLKSRGRKARHADVAQQVERFLGKEEVPGFDSRHQLLFFPLKLPKIDGVTVKITVNFLEGKSGYAVERCVRFYFFAAIFSYARSSVRAVLSYTVFDITWL